MTHSGNPIGKNISSLIQGVDPPENRVVPKQTKIAGQQTSADTFIGAPARSASEIIKDALYGKYEESSKALGKLKDLNEEEIKVVLPILVNAIKQPTDIGSNLQRRILNSFENLGEKAKEAVPALIKIIKDENNEYDENSYRTAIYAIEYMGMSSVKEAIPDLIEIINDNNKDSRAYREIPYVLLRNGSKDPKVISALIEILKKETNAEEDRFRDSIIQALYSDHVKVDINDLKNFIPHLMKILKNEGERDDVRIPAAWALEKIDPDSKELIYTLIEMVSDLRKPPISRDFRETILTLLKLNEKAVSILKGGSTFPIALAIKDQKKAIPALIEALKDKDDKVRFYAVLALRILGADAEDAIPALIEALKDKDKRVREHTVDVLGKIGETGKKNEKEVFYGLTEALNNDDKYVKQGASDVIRRLMLTGSGYRPGGKVTYDFVVDKLIDSLNDEDPTVRANAIRALIYIEQKKVLENKKTTPALVKALKDPDDVVIQDALSLIKTFSIKNFEEDPASFVNGLINVLENNRDPESKRVAIEILENQGKEAKKAVPLLLNLLKHERLSDKANSALRKLGINILPELIQHLNGKVDPYILQIVTDLDKEAILELKAALLSRKTYSSKQEEREDRDITRRANIVTVLSRIATSNKKKLNDEDVRDIFIFLTKLLESNEKSEVKEAVYRAMEKISEKYDQNTLR